MTTSTCDYCEQAFSDDDAYLAHLRDEHYDELGRLDKHRVDDRSEQGRLFKQWKPVTGIVLVVLAVIAVGGYFALGTSLSGGFDGQPTVNGTKTTAGQQPAQLEMAMSGTFAKQGTALNMRMACPRCGEYCKACPSCDNTFAKAVAEMPGVFGAKFTANEPSQSAIKIEYDPEQTSIKKIQQKITSTPPYQGCCDDLTPVSS